MTYATERETSEGKVFTVTGGDWDTVVGGTDPLHDERIVVNMGPQHPSTHGVLRLILELEGETVTEARCGVGYLHTGIEKNMEYRSWTQGVTFCTRMDYLSPFYNEATYVLGIGERLINIPAGSTKRMDFVCRLNRDVPSKKYRLKIKTVFDNPSNDGATQGKILLKDVEGVF